MIQVVGSCTSCSYSRGLKVYTELVTVFVDGVAVRQLTHPGLLLLLLLLTTLAVHKPEWETLHVLQYAA